MVPTVMARANGRNASPVSRAEKPSTVWRKIEVRKTVADQDAGDAEHHRGAGDQGLELPDVRREQRLGGTLLELQEAASRTAETASAVTVWTDHQPWVVVPLRP